MSDEPNNVKPFLRRVEPPKQEEPPPVDGPGKFVLGGDSELTMDGIVTTIQEQNHNVFSMVFVSTPKVVEDIVQACQQVVTFMDRISDGRDYKELHEFVQALLHSIACLLVLERRDFTLRVVYVHTPFGSSFTMIVSDDDDNDLFHDQRTSLCGLNFLQPT